MMLKITKDEPTKAGTPARFCHGSDFAGGSGDTDVDQSNIGLKVQETWPESGRA